MAFSQDITANKRLHLQLQEFAFQDVLIGMANRRAFGRTVENAVAEATYSSSGFALAVVDLNNLKLINDEHGHRVGNDVIRAAGLMLSDMLERHELAARVGSDEFYLLLRTSDQKALDERVRRIRVLPRTHEGSRRVPATSELQHRRRDVVPRSRSARRPVAGRQSNVRR